MSIPLHDIFYEENEEEAQEILAILPQDIISLLQTDEPAASICNDGDENIFKHFHETVARNHLEGVQSFNFDELPDHEIYLAIRNCITNDSKEIFEFLFKKMNKNDIHFRSLVFFTVKGRPWFLKFIAANIGEEIALPFNEAFSYATSYGQVESLLALIDIAPDFAAKEKQNLFDFAIVQDQISIAQIFIKMGADIHFANDAPFFSAIEYESTKFLEFFFESGEIVSKDVMQDGLRKAIRERAYGIVELLLKYGADVNDEEILKEAFDSEDRDIFDILFENGLDPRIQDDIILKTALGTRDNLLARIVVMKIAENRWRERRAQLQAWIREIKANFKEGYPKDPVEKGVAIYHLRLFEDELKKRD